MVNKEKPLYLFIGQDISAKDISLASIKQEFLPPKLENFNLDILYARELNLKGLQERLLALPVKAEKRVIVIKEANGLKQEVKKFLLGYCQKPSLKIILVLDVERSDPRDEFIGSIARYSNVCRFKESVRWDTFMLSRQINLKRPDQALKILHQLLMDGEKPERILGGLRYSCEKDRLGPEETKRRFKALINCDIEIKTGKLKSDFALEKLVVSLCALSLKSRPS